jgi:hypothetical protein
MKERPRYGQVQPLIHSTFQVFQGAFDGIDAEDDERSRSVVGAVMLAVNPLPPSAIATLVGLGKQEVMDTTSADPVPPQAP